MEPLDDRYFEWLYDQVASKNKKNPAYNYWNILRILFSKEFVWIIPNDDNRAEDGRSLRDEFRDSQNIRDIDPNWMMLGCSVLELLIAISRRLSFTAEGEPAIWFWELMDNLDLRRFNDAVKIPAKHVDERLDDLIWRTYDPNGRGGLFPLQDPQEDQRDVELWYQMSAYLLEKS